jgi:hypothetical protein
VIILHDSEIKSPTGPVTGPSYSIWAAQRFGPKTIEAASFGAETQFLTRTFGNPLIDAADVAFNNHLPFRLRPEDVWLCLQSGIAQHIIKNAESVRELFVTHQGQETLIVNRDEFLPGSSKNDWQGSSWSLPISSAGTSANRSGISSPPSSRPLPWWTSPASVLGS